MEPSNRPEMFEEYIKYDPSPESESKLAIILTYYTNLDDILRKTLVQCHLAINDNDTHYAYDLLRGVLLEHFHIFRSRNIFPEDAKLIERLLFAFYELDELCGITESVDPTSPKEEFDNSFANLKRSYQQFQEYLTKHFIAFANRPIVIRYLKTFAKLIYQFNGYDDIDFIEETKKIENNLTLKKQ